MLLETAERLLQQGKLRELLGVPANAAGADLEKACRAARVRHHPDKGGSHELACIIDEAIRNLKETEGSATKPTFPWKATFVYMRVSEYEASLRKECQKLESGIKQALGCLEKCGYGDNRPPCSETCDCKCTGHNAQRLRNEAQGLDVLISWADDALNEANHASNVGSGEELRLMDLLRELLDKSKDSQHKCNTRAYLFDELSCTPRQAKHRNDEQPERQTAASRDSAGVASPEQRGVVEQSEETPAAADSAADEQQEKELHGAASPRVEEASKVAAMRSSMPNNQETQAERAKMKRSHTSKDSRQKKHKSCLYATSGADVDLSLFTIRFPRVSKLSQQCDPANAKDLKHLWYEYRKACQSRCKRLERDQPTYDLDEKLTRLKQEAWSMLQLAATIP